MAKPEILTIKIPGTFTEDEILKISNARNACVEMSKEANRVADDGAQLYVTCIGNLDLLEGLPFKFEVSPDVYREICTLAGRVNF